MSAVSVCHPAPGQQKSPRGPSGPWPGCDSGLKKDAGLLECALGQSGRPECSPLQRTVLKAKGPSVSSWGPLCRQDIGSRRGEAGGACGDGWGGRCR